MRVFHLSWEYPPKKVGGLASHVFDLTKELANLGLEVHVITCNFPGAEDYELIDRVHVHRFPALDIPGGDFLHWALMMGLYMKLKAVEVAKGWGRPSLVHAHDWHSAIAALFLKHAYRIPLISTIHSTENGRRGGIHSDYQALIHGIEDKLIYESWRVICCSHFMKREITSTFGCPWDKVDVIPNGVRVKHFDFDFDRVKLKQKFALPWERIVLFVGRLVPEKGCDLLLGAAPFILKEVPEAKFVVVGDGYMKERYLNDARFLGIYEKCFLTGYLDDHTLRSLYQVADVVAVPSRYEPFGIVALEAMAARTPVVIAETGGLCEIVEHEKDGIKVWVNHSESLAWGIKRALLDKELVKRITLNARHKVEEKYNWGRIARLTLDVYHEVLAEYATCDWKPVYLPI
jgi:1,4-alpha-glucan branching enzyme